MSHEAMSPLRRRMIEDMTIRPFGEPTKRDAIRQVRAFTAFLGRSPDAAEPEDLRRCGGRLIIVERFRRGESAQTRPPAVVRIDTS